MSIYSDRKMTELRTLVMHATTHHEIRAVIGKGKTASAGMAECLRALDGVPNVDPHSLMFYIEPERDQLADTQDACTPLPSAPKEWMVRRG